MTTPTHAKIISLLEAAEVPRENAIDSLDRAIKARGSGRELNAILDDIKRNLQGIILIRGNEAKMDQFDKAYSQL